MILSDNAIADLKKILESKQIFLTDEELQKCGVFLLTVVSRSLKINKNV